MFVQLSDGLFSLGTHLSRLGAAESDAGSDTALGEEFEQMRKQGHVAPVANFLGHRAFIQTIADGRGDYRGIGTSYRLQERGAEG